MLNNNFLTILKSTLIVFIISLLGAFGAFLININYYVVFIFLFVIQYILFSFIGNIITNFFHEKTIQKQLDVLEPLSSILNCAYCNASNIITFFPNENERIEFLCEKCKNKNLVTIGFNVARVTSNIDTQNITGIPLIKNEKK